MTSRLLGAPGNNQCGVHSGVTTLIDPGGPSCMTLPAFREFVVKPKHSRVFAYLSAYLVGGMEGHYYPALYRPDCLDVDATVKAALANTDIVTTATFRLDMVRYRSRP